MQCFLIVLMFFAQLLPISLQEADMWYEKEEGGRKCKLCPAGEFQMSCTKCKPCPAGSYTNQTSAEPSCHRCFGDCKPEAAAIISGQDKHTPSSASSGHTSTSAKSCNFPKCGPPSFPQAGNDTHLKTDKTNSRLAAILCPIVVIGFLALVILSVVRCHGDESCLKQAMSKLCNEGSREGSHKLKEPTHQLPRDSFSAKQQPSSLLAANLGPVHVHNPRTVIFSLFNQFTDQVGSTIEGVKTVKRGCSKEEDERDCPVFQPTPSTRVHLSEEERSVEMDSTFLPSQEEGKDCHMSKEEVL
ncbi:uncharacterized protein si:dkey-260g12.1 isoform X3 [Labrus bergylta]|uniref:uncharacterized protein si:dkey-260g12.1 isoform X3 n=1 Tax=Labrus bergylta TaxID=56723 RepID=UPI00331373A9